MMQPSSFAKSNRIPAFPAKPVKREVMFGNRCGLFYGRLAVELRDSLSQSEREALLTALHRKHANHVRCLSISQRNAVRVLLACNRYSTLEEFFQH